MKSYNLEELCKIVGGISTKIEDAQISKLAPPLLADENTLALALSEEEISNLSLTKAKIALVPLGVNSESVSTIEVERPKLAMMKLLHLFYIPPETNLGVHPSAVVCENVDLGENVSIGANVYVGRNVKISSGTKVLPNCYIGKNVTIGENCFIHPGVNIGDSVKIGNRVIIQQGASIAADGFSFVSENPDNIEKARQDGEIKSSNENQKIFKIPSIGSVEIDDDVEIGANTCIDRGTIENTKIGAMTKIDNLVQIGHNCKIGKACLIVSQVGIAGSCNIGDRVVIAGQSGLADHLTIGSDSIIMASSGVSKSYPEKSILAGTPAVQRKDFIKQLKMLKDASEIVKKFKKYEPLLKQFEQEEEEIK